MAIDIKQLRQLLKQYKQQALQEYGEMEERRHRFVTNGYFDEMSGGGYMVNFADEPHRPLYAGLFNEIKYLSSVLNTKFDERRRTQDADLTLERLEEAFREIKQIREQHFNAINDEKDTFEYAREVIKTQKEVYEHDLTKLGITKEAPYPVKAGKLFSEVAAEFLEYKINRRDITRDDTIIHAEAYIYKCLLCFEVDKPINYYTKADFQRLLSNLTKFPKHFKTYKDIRNLSLKDILKEAKAGSYATLAPKTINNYIDYLFSVFEYAKGFGNYIQELPVQKEYLKLNERKPNELDDSDKVRMSFTEDQMILMLESKNLNEWLEKYLLEDPWRVWLIILLWFTGARIQELAQLYIDDITQEENYTCIFIRPNKARFQNVKNKPSKRVIPLHPFILECGFMEYVNRQKANKQERLFGTLEVTELVKKRGWGQYPAKELGKWLKPIIMASGANPAKYVIHSFRHTVNTKLLDKCEDAVAAEYYIGHKIDSEGFNSYFHGNMLDRKYRAICSLDFSFAETKLNSLKNRMRRFYGLGT